MLPFKSRVRKPEASLNSRSNFQEDKLSLFSQSIETLVSAIKDLASSKNNPPKQNSNSFNSSGKTVSVSTPYPQIQERFRFLSFDIPILGEERKNEKMKQWFAEMYSVCLSQGFSYFQKGMSEGKVRAFCGQNIISNTIQFIKANGLGKKELIELDRHIKQQVLPFALSKYPQSQTKEVNLKLAKIIKPINNYSSTEYDYIFKSGIKFAFNDNGNYNSEIMRFLNYLIEITQTKCGDQTLYEIFQNQMEDFFELIQKEQWMLQMKNNSQNKTENNILVKDIQTSEDGLKYSTKVMEYSKYLIGRKISENTKSFTERQINDSFLEVKNTGLMRIISKWCEQLWNTFDETMIAQRQQMFRMRDGTERYLQQKQKLCLITCLKNQKKEVIKFLKEANECFFENQAYLIQKGFNQNDQNFCSKRENMNGMFVCLMEKCGHNYSINYLNKLIHCILSAQNEWATQLNHQSHRTNLIPSLISFKIGDLMRSKCSSKQNEITSLYKQLMLLSQNNPDEMQIIRVKNRLNSGTKDILINLMFKKTCVIQIQLAINSDQSNFIKCSDSFNHFLYELIRSQFGCISQLSNIVYRHDSRMSFFDKKILKKNRWNSECEKKPHKEDCNRSSIQSYLFPFECSQCKTFCYDVIYGIRHEFCEDCQRWICNKCRIKNKQAEQINYLVQKSDLSVNIISQGQMGIIKLKKKDIEMSEGICFSFDGKKYIFEKQPIGDKVYFEEITSSQAKQRYEENKVFIAKKLNSNQLWYRKENFSQRIMKKKIKDCQEKMKKYFTVGEKNIQPKQFQSSTAPHVQTISIIETSLEKTSQIANCFPNTSIAILKKNKINQFGGLAKWGNLKQLDLQNNGIKQIPSQIENLQNLQILNMDSNQIVDIHQSLYDLKKLRKLYLSMNNISYIDKKIKNLKNLQALWLRQNEIQVIPEEIGELTQISVLVLHKNKLSSLPQSLKNLTKMNLLNFCENQISEIPENMFNNWSEFQSLWAYQNKIKKIPIGLKNCKKLRRVVTFNNELKQVPIQIYEIENAHLEFSRCPVQLPITFTSQSLRTKSIKFSNCKLTQVPELLLSMKTLCEVTLSENKIKALPPTIKNWKNLLELWIYQNQISELPQQIGQLVQLKKLVAHTNKLSSLPDSVRKLRKIQNLDLGYNNYEQFPKVILELPQLKFLYIQNNPKIEELPEDIHRLKCLQQLYIGSLSKLNKIPENLRKCQDLKKIFHTRKYLSQQSIKLINQISTRK